MAALGAILTARLAGLPRGTSIQDPKSIKLLPESVRRTIQEVFVNALHPLFLVSAGVTLLAVILCVALPDRELKGPGEPTAPESNDADDNELAAVQMEAKATTLI